jgi:hypothetical protein
MRKEEGQNIKISIHRVEKFIHIKVFDANKSTVACYPALLPTTSN